MKYGKEELEEAKKSITSIISKCEKSLLKLKENSPQQTLLVRRIKALHISADLIENSILQG